MFNTANPDIRERAA